MVPAALYVDGGQVKAVDLVRGLEKLVAQLSRHHFILLCQLGLLGQQAPHQRVNSTCKEPGDEGRVGTSSTTDPSLHQTFPLRLKQSQPNFSGHKWGEKSTVQPAGCAVVLGEGAVQTACFGVEARAICEIIDSMKIRFRKKIF